MGKSREEVIDILYSDVFDRADTLLLNAILWGDYKDPTAYELIYDIILALEDKPLRYIETSSEEEQEKEKGVLDCWTSTCPPNTIEWVHKTFTSGSFKGICEICGRKYGIQGNAYGGVFMSEW